jgi:hypothetical protein
MSATIDETRRKSEDVTGISNVAYDLMVVLTNKLQGIAALETYKEDAASVGDNDAKAVFDRMIENDRRDVDQLRTLVATRV